MVLSTDVSNAPLMEEMFQPSLPFVRSMQSMTDPNVWQDISLPGIYISHAPTFFIRIYDYLNLPLLDNKIRLDDAKSWHRHEKSCDDL